MISSMQRNKKWLLPTIWISTIAFVGAGFVGWGSYNPSTSSSSLATVGNKEVSVKALQDEYSNLYSQYAQALGKQFNKEFADKLKLDDIAYRNIIQKYLLLNLSEDLGFVATDEEVLKELLNIKVFQKDGKFDSDLYKSILKQNRTTPSEFEEKVRIDLQLQKLQDIYAADVNQNTLKMINELFFSTDRVSINIINHDDIKVTVSDDELLKYYENNKNNYLSDTMYKLNIEIVAINGDEKASKKTALRKYLKLKKGTEQFTTNKTISKADLNLNKEQEDILFSSAVDTVVKPMKINNDFVIYQIKEVIKPQPLAYDQVAAKIKEDLINSKKQALLKEKVNTLIGNFKGIDIGYLNKEEINKIDGLDPKDVVSLIKTVSSSTSKIDSVSLDNKTVVFNITDTKLAKYDKTKDKYIEDTIKQIKNNEIMDSILKNLESKYEVISNYKVK